MKIATKLSFAALLGVVLGMGTGFAPVSSAVAQMSSIEIGGSSGSEGKDVKEPEAVKKVVDKLSSATKNMSVEDLNAAREAVAKLDVLIDIEKRLNDLADIRAERQEKEGMSVPAPLPAAVIAPPAPPADFSVGFPGSGASVTQSAPIVPPPPPVIESVSMDVDRVIGAAGRYIALVRVAGESQKQIRVGDKISDGSVVESITPLGVTLSKDKKNRTIKVNNPAPLFGAKK